MRFDSVIFDVDGTILDTKAGILASVRYMIDTLNMPKIGEEEILSFVGPRIQDSLSRVYGLSGEECARAAAVFRERYKQGDVLKAEPYEGVFEVLDHLRKVGCKLSVATNKRQDFTDALMEKYGMERYFSAVNGTDMGGLLKKKDLIERCIGQTGSDAGRTVLIGDSSYDAEAAKEVGIAFVGALYGYDFKIEEDVKAWAPVAVIRDIRELPEIL